MPDALTSDEGLKLAVSLSRPDLVLPDIVMPGLNGIEVPAESAQSIPRPR